MTLPAMPLWSADDLAAVTGGRWLNARPAAKLPTGITYDRNYQRPGDLFVTMNSQTYNRGEAETVEPLTWDSADRLRDLQCLGCAGAIIERDVKEAPPGFPLLRVADSAQAVNDLATAGRNRYGGALIAVTGTVGKSTVREMIRHVLSRQAETFGYSGNFNTYFGMALCMAQLNPNAVFSVFEVAMSALARTENPVAEKLRPNVAIITAISREQTSLAPTLDHTVRYKARLFRGLAPGGTAVINRDIAMYDQVLERARRFEAPRIVTYGRHAGADIRLLDFELHGEYSRARAVVHGEEIEYEVPVPGSAMIANSLAMLAAVEAVGADWRQAARDLITYRARQGRLQRARVPIAGAYFDLIDDTWNNTEAAMLANFEVLRLAEPAPGGRRIAVLQQIGWIDGISQEVHAGLAAPLKDSRADKVFTLGDEMLHMRAGLPPEMLGLHATAADELASAVLDEVRPGDVVSAKGSSITAGFADVMRRLRRGRPPVPTSKEAQDARRQQAPVDLRDRRHLSINLLGDFYLGDFYQRRKEARGGINFLSEQGYSHSMRNTGEFLRTADFSIVNFDGVLTRSRESPFAGRKKLLLDADPKQTVKTLRSHKIGAVALGNGHSFDFGLNRLWTMLAQFSKANIRTFGADQREGQAVQPLRIAAEIGGLRLGIQVFSAVQYSRKADQDLKVLATPDRPGVACLSEELISAIAEARESAPQDLIIAYPHWGDPYTWRTSQQREIAGWLIGAGADLVLGHGARMLQEIERVDGRWVVNGLGNFVFNSDGEYDERKVPPYSLAARLELSNEGAALQRKLKLYPLLSENRKTNFRPRFVDAAEFDEIGALLKMRNPGLSKDADAFRTGCDGIGWHFEIHFDRAQPAKALPRPSRQRRGGRAGAASGELPVPRTPALWNARDLAMATGGTWISAPTADWQATGFSIAKNHLDPGDLFVCMDAATWHQAEATADAKSAEEKWDNARNLAGLKAAGAAGAIVQRDVGKPPKAFPVLLVGNAANAVHDLAAAARKRFKGKVIAVTGTVGKTTTREMLKHVFGCQGETSGTIANFNTRLGVPYSVARTPAGGDYAVFEMAVSSLYGKSGPASLLVRPHVAIITSIGLAHTSYVQDVEATARYKARIFQGLEPGGVAVINRDLASYPLLAQLAKEYGAADIVTFGAADEANVRLRDLQLAADHSLVHADVFGEQVSYEVPIAGKGMAMNSLACLAAVRMAGADWRRAAADLAYYRTISGRARRYRMRLPSGSWELIDDAANAAPLSMKQGIEVLGLAAPGPGGRRIAVLGRMAELGERTLALHAELAPVVVGSGIDKLFTAHDELLELRNHLPSAILGPHSDSTLDLAGRLLSDVRAGDVVLVKGSHSGSDFHKLPGYLRLGQTNVSGAPSLKAIDLAARHSLDICLIGDTYFGEFYQDLRQKHGQRNYLATKGYDHALLHLAPFLESADFCIANLEATLTEQPSSPFSGTKDWILKGDPAKTLAALKAVNIGAAALGNNHTVDYGRGALDDTLDAARSAGVIAFGAGRNATDAAAPLEIMISLAGGTRRLGIFSAYQYVREFEEDLQGYARGPEGGIACIDDEFYSAISGWKEKYPDGFAIAFPHWGKNYMWRSRDQKRLADSMVGAGADLIIGHGAHMMQEIARRRGRWVVYSLGNGYFGSEGEYARRNMPPYSFLARLNVNDRGGAPAFFLRLYPIVSDNQKTRFQPRFVTAGEFRDVTNFLDARNPGPFSDSGFLPGRRDEFGWHLELPVD
ncbi:MAG TPA: CapA family protein [Verrucomicrobiae bacterium]|nr:CapA family protein [Verrucomicrobiae bacterium]